MSLTKNDWILGEVLRLYLSGYSQDKIGNDINVSIGTVNSIINDAVSHDNSLEVQRQIAIAMKKSGISLQQIAGNLRWKNLVKIRSLDEKKIEKILDSMEKLINEYGFPPSESAGLFVSLLEFMLKKQIDPSKLEEEIMAKQQDLQNIINEIGINKQSLEKSQAVLQEQLSKRKLTQKTLDTIDNILSIFEIYDADITDFGRLARAIEDFKKQGWDAKEIVLKYEKIQTLDSAIKKLDARLIKAQSLLEHLREKQRKEETRWKSYDNAFAVFEQLTQAGLKPQDIFNVSYILNTDFSPGLVSQLIEEIKTYGSIASATARLERKNEIEDDTLL